MDKRSKLTRRQILKVGGATFVTASVVASSGLVVGDAWAAAPESLKPETYKTLVQMSRDIYPHDRFPDKLYAKAVEGLDKAAAGDDTVKSLLEDGVGALNTSAQAAHGHDYTAVAWELERVDLLRTIEGGDFFQKVRGHLVSALYNQKEVWALLGYEGESASHGGYIDRGFSDIDWI